MLQGILGLVGSQGSLCMNQMMHQVEGNGTSNYQTTIVLVFVGIGSLYKFMYSPHIII